MSAVLPADIWELIAHESDLLRIQALTMTCKTVRDALMGSLGLWRMLVKRLLECSPSYAISQALPSAGVDELRASVIRFAKVQSAIHSGQAAVENVIVREVSMPASVIGMTALLGTAYVAFMDPSGRVHVADMNKACIVHTWEYTHEPVQVVSARLSTWDSPLHGLVLVGNVYVLREHTGGSDELWFLSLNMDHAEATHPRLTPLLINPDLSFCVEEVTAFGNTVAVRCNEGPGAMTQFLCTFVISKEGKIENLHVWEWDPNGEDILCDDVPIHMINHNTIFTFWVSEAYVLRLGEPPNQTVRSIGTFWVDGDSKWDRCSVSSRVTSDGNMLVSLSLSEGEVFWCRISPDDGEHDHDDEDGNEEDEDENEGQQRAISYDENRGPTVLPPWVTKKAQVTSSNLCSMIHNESGPDQRIFVQLTSPTPRSSPYSSDIMTPIMPNPDRRLSASEPLRIASYCRTSFGPKSDVVYSLIFDEWTGKIALCTVPEPGRRWQSRAAAGVASCNVTIIDLLGDSV